MSDERTISVAEVSEGPGGNGEPGTTVSLPVVELLTGRGFVTGKSGSGKSNTASVIAENLLDAGFGLLVVDIDGEYYGLKEEYEILHVGADEECDIQVTTEHAEKIANLALEQNVPIILDISSFLDEDEAEALLTEVSKQLFAKAKKLKQPFLMLVEEVHEWIPENGSVGEVGKMLIKIGKRGRKHGLGIVGISQRPADVKKDYITQCDWLVWHRLTWNNDTKVVRRVLDGEYASAVEDLDDGEAFMMTDWSESVRRVQFHRKQTFDAGATPGLDDFERPELKSVSDDLVSELESISEEKAQRESTIEELREELDKKNSRIAELEKELQDARDLSRMADQFVDAMLDHVEGASPGRTETERMRARRKRREGQAPEGPEQAEETLPQAGADAPAPDDSEGASANGDEFSSMDDDAMADAAEAFAAAMDDEEDSAADDPATADAESAGTESDDPDADATATGVETDFPSFEEPEDMPRPEESSELDFSEADLPEFGFETPDSQVDEDSSANGSSAADPSGSTGGMSAAAAMEPQENSGFQVSADSDEEDVRAADQPHGSEDVRAAGEAHGSEGVRAADQAQGSDDDAIAAAVSAVDGGGMSQVDNSGTHHIDRPTPAAVDSIRAEIRGLDEKTRRMLAYYDEQGPATPLDAHFVAGGTGDRTNAYAHNRELRIAGLIEHVGRGNYDTCIRSRLDDATDGRLDEDELDAYRTRLATEFGRAD